MGDARMVVPLGLVCLAYLSCCGPHDIVKPNYRTATSAPPGTVWLGPITLVGDNQEFHIGNRPTLFRSGYTDEKFSSSAVRVPQQDLFGGELLAVAASDSKSVLVHLGDAMDLSCADEWNEFERMLDSSGRPSWFWAPGNHDGFFFGNFIGPTSSWDSACHPAQRMTKDQILGKYIEQLRTYSNGTLDPKRGSFSCAPGTTCGALRQAAWHIENGNGFYRSFVLQEIEIPMPAGMPMPAGRPVTGASLILIDTSTYERAPRIAPSEPLFRYAAGEEGHVGPDQLKLLREWVDRATRAGRLVVLAGHHPFKDLDEVARARLQEMVESKQVATYISAHTHWGQYYTHKGTNGYSWLEPNIGSVLDYDAEFGQLTLGVHADATFVRMSRVKLGSYLSGQRGADLGIVCGDHPDWFARPEDADFYTRYKTTRSIRGAAVDQLYFRTMLAALARYWRCVPTLDAAPPVVDACVPNQNPCATSSSVSARIDQVLKGDNLDEMRATTLDLLKQDASRTVDACQRRAYFVCQAMWAAEYEKRSYVTPSRDEDIFEVNTATRTELR